LKRAKRHLYFIYITSFFLEELISIYIFTFNKIAYIQLVAIFDTGKVSLRIQTCLLLNQIYGNLHKIYQKRPIMRPGSVKLIPIAIALIFMITACKKKDDNPPAFTHRIISEKGYLNDQLDYNETYEYSGDKVSRFYIVGTNWSTEDLLTYPDATRININYNKTYGQNVYCPYVLL
jgi:hypothetical protein